MYGNSLYSAKHINELLRLSVWLDAHNKAKVAQAFYDLWLSKARPL